MGVSKIGPDPSGSMITAPSEARNTATCSWAARAIAVTAGSTPVGCGNRKLWGSLNPGLAARKRSFRK